MKLLLVKEPDNNFDKIGDTAKAKVVLVSDRGVICKVSKKSLLHYNGKAAEVTSVEEG